jgi:hypothetical protein
MKAEIAHRVHSLHSPHRNISLYLFFIQGISLDRLRPTSFGVIGFIGARGADRSLGLRFLRSKMLVAFGRDKFRKAFRFLSMVDPAAKGQGPIPQTVVKKFARTTFATAHPNRVGFWQRFGIALRRPFEPLPRRRAYAT